MCDTFIATSSYTKDKTFIFGKNSDREPNEAQSIVLIPRKSNKQNKVECTYTSIPQVATTNAVILSKPFWMWGAEMGINEHGVVIGNEAVFTKISAKKSNILTGMDLIRLALERTNTAENALNLITDYIEIYGQGGNGGYKNKLYYFNSFIIADKKSAWILETADKFWVAKKINNYYSISNRLTIENDYDRSSKNLIDKAIKKGFFNKKDEFSFSKTFSDKFYTYFSKSKHRLDTTCNLATPKGEFTVQSAIKILSSHFDNKFKPSKNYAGGSVCMHANGMLNPTQTTGSMIVELKENSAPKILLTGTSNPCLSLFKPFEFGGESILENNFLQPTKNYDRSFWWEIERFHRLVMQNYAQNKAIFIDELVKIQEAILSMTHDLWQNNHKIDDYSKETISLHLEKKTDWNNAIKKENNSYLWHLFYRNYWNKQNKDVNLTL